MLIDRDYFINDINLPQAANEFQQTSLDDAINIYEPEILKRLLGYNLWNIMNTAWLDSIKDLNPVALPDRFDKLINGNDFTFSYNGATIVNHWNGFRNDEKISIDSYYVYFKYRNNVENHTSTTGEISTDHEFSSNRNSLPKLVYAWNRMIELYGETPKPYNLDLRSRREVREHFLFIANYRYYNILPSAYNYLLTNKATYPEWVFEPAYTINALGI